MNEKILKKLINECVTKLINEGFQRSDEELKNETANALETAHKALNGILMTLYINSQSSAFAQDLFNKVKEADDAILFARKDF